MFKQKSKTLEPPPISHPGVTTTTTPYVFQLGQLPLPPVFRYNINDGIEFLPTLYSPFIPSRKNSSLLTDVRNATLSKIMQNDRPRRYYSPVRKKNGSNSSNIPVVDINNNPHSDAHVFLNGDRYRDSPNLQKTNSKFVSFQTAAVSQTARDKSLELSEHFKARINSLFKAKKRKSEELRLKQEEWKRRKGKHHSSTKKDNNTELVVQKKSIVTGLTMLEEKEKLRETIRMERLMEHMRTIRKPLVPLVTISLDIRKRDDLEIESPLRAPLPTIRQKPAAVSIATLEVGDIRPWTNQLQNEGQLQS